ncbi:hypothetical protein ACRE_090590 [Hapsidospora chrysogenum ATCC 11550]|uniref:Uncharacterized protein n=1 Tax=Hapsidospora chrysogenum (strain ATCC 11550 / CBS 779.69 / DSM 880 / IAM 14645 / JCM 23072 / IMI 49137) TaxID=857340 RepID=A0A086ST51_HAPC1|nr:hypothetical protein ACRE_090590 [Hapsidospora chrysogenum ATCC 11550]
MASNTISSRTSIEWSDEVAAEEEKLKLSKSVNDPPAIASGTKLHSSNRKGAQMKSEKKRTAFRLVVDRVFGENSLDTAVKRSTGCEPQDSDAGAVKASEDAGESGNAPITDSSHFKYPRYSQRVQSKSEPFHMSQSSETGDDVLDTVPELSEGEEVVR